MSSGQRSCQSMGRLLASAWPQLLKGNQALQKLASQCSPSNKTHKRHLCSIQSALDREQASHVRSNNNDSRHHHRHHGLPRLKLGVASRRQLNTVQVMRPYVDPKVSYAFGRSSEPLVYSTVGRELDRQLLERPDELAYVSHSERIKRTHRELNDDVNRLAKTLLTKLGLKRGDSIGVFAYNCYNWLVIQFACSRIGTVLSPINPSYKGEELAFVLRKGQIRCLFMPGPKSVQAELNNHLEILQSEPVLELFAKPGQMKLESVVLMDGENHYDTGHGSALQSSFKLGEHGCRLVNWSEVQSDGLVFRSAQEADRAGLRPEEACILSPELVSPDDLFAIYYTSGTTGRPKGACITHFQAINNARFAQLRVRNGRPRDWRVVAASPLPMFHIYAGVLNALGPILGNTAMVMPSFKYDISAFVGAIIEHGATMSTMTPTMLIDLLAYVERHALRGLPLRVIQPGGSSLAPEVVARAFKVLPELEEVRTGYGSTETGSISNFQTIFEPEASRAQTVGPPIDYVELRVVQLESSEFGGASASQGSGDGLQLVPLGELGEIQSRGYNTMLCYLDEPAKTREVITPNRWYRTGDIGLMHPHGSLEIRGRIKNMIIKGGENIYPDEVEQMMIKLGCIEKVHVVGVPDRRLGEQVCAWVKLKPGYKELVGERPANSTDKTLVHRDDILDYCRANMTYFKVPKYLLFVDDFPMTPTKKVQGHLMVERSIEILGLQAELS